MPDNPTPTADYERSSAFAQYLPLIRAADGLTLSQLCALTSLESSTVQNWIKRGFVPHPVRKKYCERHIARIMLINALRRSMQIDRVGELMTYLNGNADDESDDIISDVALYDVFCRISAAVSCERLPMDAIENRVGEIICDCLPSCSDSERLKKALTVMATAAVAAVFKQEADRLYTELFKEENHG